MADDKTDDIVKDDIEEGTEDTDIDDDIPPEDSDSGENDDDSPAPKPKESEEGKEDDEVDQPPVRRSSVHNLQHIIARKNKKIEKLLQDKKDDTEDDAGKDYGEELSPEAQRAIDRRIQEATAPLLGNLAKESDEAELKELFSQELEAKKLEKRIRAYMEHDAWKHVPVAAIYHHLAYKDAKKTGAQKRQGADEEAAASGAGGHGRRPTGAKSGLDLRGKSDKEIQDIQNQVLMGKKVK